jgi:hypothetical protein
MTDRERFLKLATWSLWGEQKKIVRMELEAHIEHKIWKYQVKGLNQTQALEKTLADLGQPHVISAGMTGVYTMPNIIRKAGLMILLSSLGIGAFNAGAQISGTSTFPTPECLAGKNTEFTVGTQTIPCQSNLIWLHKPSLKTVLEQSGVRVSVATDWTNLSLSFPGALHQINIRNEIGATFRDEKGNVVIRGDPEYMSGQRLFESLPIAGLPVHIKGWENPVISVGKTEFTLEQKNSKFSSTMIYWSALFSSIYNLRPSNQTGTFSILNADNPADAFRNLLPPERTLKIANSQINEVYVIATRVPRPNQTELRAHEIRPALANNELRIHTNFRQLQFANTTKEYFENNQINAIVYKFTGRLDVYGQVLKVVPPSEIQVLP